MKLSQLSKRVLRHQIPLKRLQLEGEVGTVGPGSVLNQRSQRRSYTWAAYTELMGLLALEQPRIAHGPSNHPSLAAKRNIHEEPGAGKPHAGGLSGNWQSYRDQLILEAPRQK